MSWSNKKKLVFNINRRTVNKNKKSVMLLSMLKSAEE